MLLFIHFTVQMTGGASRSQRPVVRQTVFGAKVLLAVCNLWLDFTWPTATSAPAGTEALQLLTVIAFPGCSPRAVGSGYSPEQWCTGRASSPTLPKMPESTASSSLLLGLDDTSCFYILFAILICLFIFQVSLLFPFPSSKSGHKNMA